MCNSQWSSLIVEESVHPMNHGAQEARKVERKNSSITLLKPVLDVQRQQKFQLLLQPEQSNFSGRPRRLVT